jgi:hypothetical protein
MSPTNSYVSKSFGGCSHDYTKITVDSWARMTSARWNFVIKTTPNKEDCIVGTDCLNGIKKNVTTQVDRLKVEGF